MMVIITRRQFISSAPAILGGSSVLAACSQSPDPDSHKAVAAQTWRRGSLLGLEGAALSHELVRYATLAPSSHYTQCWKFAVDDKAYDPARHVTTLSRSGSGRPPCLCMPLCRWAVPPRT